MSSDSFEFDDFGGVATEPIDSLSAEAATVLTAVGESCVQPELFSNMDAADQSQILDTLHRSFSIALLPLEQSSDEPTRSKLLEKIAALEKRMSDTSVMVMITRGDVTGLVWDVLESARWSLRTSYEYFSSLDADEDIRAKRVRVFAKNAVQAYLESCKHQGIDAEARNALYHFYGEAKTPAVDVVTAVKRVVQQMAPKCKACVSKSAREDEILQALPQTAAPSPTAAPPSFQMLHEPTLALAQSMEAEAAEDERSDSTPALAKFFNGIALSIPIIGFISILCATVAAMFNNTGTVFLITATISFVVTSLIAGAFGFVGPSSKMPISSAFDLSCLLPKRHSGGSIR